MESQMKRVTAIVTTAIFAAAGLAFAAPANAETCRESILGEDIFGNKRFNCSDGSYTLKKPWTTNRWDDPWATYKFESNSSRRDSWSGDCKYSSFGSSYRCSGGYNDRFSSGSRYGSNGLYGSNGSNGLYDSYGLGSSYGSNGYYGSNW